MCVRHDSLLFPRPPGMQRPPPPRDQKAAPRVAAFDFCILEARLLLTQFPRRAAPEFAAIPTPIHTSHEFFLSGA